MKLTQKEHITFAPDSAGHVDVNAPDPSVGVVAAAAAAAAVGEAAALEAYHTALVP